MLYVCLEWYSFLIFEVAFGIDSTKVVFEIDSTEMGFLFNYAEVGFEIGSFFYYFYGCHGCFRYYYICSLPTFLKAYH